MNEYLIRSHLGGYYTTYDEPELTELYCEQCGDYDEVLTYWNTEEENGKVNALSELFRQEEIKSKEELDKMISNYEMDNKLEVIENVIDDIIFNNGSNIDIIDCLYECGTINQNEKKRLKDRNRNDLKKQLKLVKDNLSSYINEKEIKETDKVLSIYLKPNKK